MKLLCRCCVGELHRGSLEEDLPFLGLPRFYLVDCGGAAFGDWGLGSRAWGLEFRPRSGLSVCGLGLQMQGACAHSPSKEEGACLVHWYTYIAWRFLPLLEPPKRKHANLV